MGYAIKLTYGFVQPLVQADQRKHSLQWPMWGKSTGDRWFASQRASKAENVSIWWLHYDTNQDKPVCKLFTNQDKPVCSYPLGKKYCDTGLFSSWLTSPELGTARSSYLARVGPVVWYTTTKNHATTQTAWTIKWRDNECDGVSNHWRLHCLLNRLLARWSKKTSKLRVTGLCEGNPPVTSGFPSQRTSNAEIVSIWLCHHAPVGMSCIHSIMSDQTVLFGP